jgi:Protein of unknown function (DUF3303)
VGDTVLKSRHGAVEAWYDGGNGSGRGRTHGVTLDTRRFPMPFILTFTIPPATRDAAIARFLATGGQPPPGVRLLGRWTQLDLCGGVVLLESEDAQALTAFAHAWSDVVELSLVPVLEDQALAEVLKRARHSSVPAEPHAEDVCPETYPEDAPVAPETTPGTTKPPYEELA